MLASSSRDAVDAVRTVVVPSGPAFALMWTVPFLTLEFCSDSHLEAQGLPPANPHSKPTLNCSKQEGGDRCFLTCQSQVHISSGELMRPHSHGHDRVCLELYMITGLLQSTVAVA